MPFNRNIVGCLVFAIIVFAILAAVAKVFTMVLCLPYTLTISIIIPICFTALIVCLELRAYKKYQESYALLTIYINGMLTKETISRFERSVLRTYLDMELYNLDSFSDAEAIGKLVHRFEAGYVEATKYLALYFFNRSYYIFEIINGYKPNTLDKETYITIKELLSKINNVT